MSNIQLMNVVTPQGNTKTNIVFEGPVTEGRVRYREVDVTNRQTGQVEKRPVAEFIVPLKGKAQYLARYGINSEATADGDVFLRVSAWERNANFLRTVLSASPNKRAQFVFSGTIQTREYQDKSNGSNRVETRVTISEMWFSRHLDPAKAQDNAGGATASGTVAPSSADAVVSNSAAQTSVPATAEGDGSFWSTLDDSRDDFAADEDMPF